MSHGFITTVADEDQALVDCHLHRLRTFNPDAPILVVSDGRYRPDVYNSCISYKAHFLHGEHLKVLGRGGEWWYRFIHGALAMKVDHIFKVDPDAMFFRPFREPIPDNSHYFGCVMPGGKFTGVQGGCQGFSRKFLYDMWDQALPSDLTLNDPMVWAPDKRDVIHIKQKYFSTDWSSAWMAHQLGITPTGYSEINSFWLEVPPNDDLQFAVTHPHKKPLPL